METQITIWKKAIADHVEDMSVIQISDTVRCASYGTGVVLNFRPIDSVYTVSLDTWKLATGKSPLIYMQATALKKVSTEKFPFLDILSGK